MTEFDIPSGRVGYLSEFCLRDKVGRGRHNRALK
jgi:hypothetical protein